MADGRDQSGGFSYRTSLPWTHIFRCFQIALDPRKLLVAAAGILVMSFSWWLLSHVFWYKAPKESDSKYSTDALKREFEGETKPDGKPYDDNDIEKIKKDRYSHDFAQWQQLDALAGEGGRFRTLPWDEYRGPNPFLFFTDTLGGTADQRKTAFTDFASGSVPVLIEPLVKLLLPVAKLLSPGISPVTRLYLFLILLSNVAIWAFCGGVITRIAAIQLANKGPITLMQAVRFVAKRYLSYLGAPLIPLGIIGVVVLGLIVFGLFALIPFVGDVFLLGIGLPVVIIGGAIMTVFLIGLVGYPMMYPTLSVEGDQSDTFDALSRSVNYVYQAPWNYIWNWFVAVLYGAAVTLFVLFFASVAVYVGKWAVGLTASMVWSDRKPEYLFVYAPESFGWRELLTKDSPYEIKPVGEYNQGWVWLKADGSVTTNRDEGVRQVYRYEPKDPEKYAKARSEYYAYNSWGAGIVCFWLTLAFLMMLGFSYSFFWSAATMIYYLMRKKVDEAELDEVFEDEEPEVPLAPPKPAPSAAPASSSPTSLTVLTSSAPTAPTPSGPAVPPPTPPGPATVPFSPPASVNPPSPPVSPPPAPPSPPTTPAPEKPDTAPPS